MPSVLIASNAPITVISEAQDRLENDLADRTDSWRFELKLYRANAASFDNTELSNTSLVSITTSEEIDKVFLFGSKFSTVTSRIMVPDFMSKLQSLWILRQTFVGEGQVYELEEVTVRVANVFIQGSYKGLFVQFESSGSPEELRAKARELASRYQIPGTIPEVAAENSTEKARQFLVLVR